MADLAVKSELFAQFVLLFQNFWDWKDSPDLLDILYCCGIATDLHDSSENYFWFIDWSSHIGIGVENNPNLWNISENPNFRLAENDWKSDPFVVHSRKILKRIRAGYERNKTSYERKINIRMQETIYLSDNRAEGAFSSGCALPSIFS